MPSQWDEERMAEVLRRAGVERDPSGVMEALRVAQAAYARADNLRTPGYRPNPGYGVRQAPGTVWRDGQSLVIEGDFKVVSHGR